MGIPKIAIEAKKYSPQNPVRVQLIRSFAGANQIIKANKLVYVTTSSYTKDAREYATQSANPTFANSFTIGIPYSKPSGEISEILAPFCENLNL